MERNLAALQLRIVANFLKKVGYLWFMVDHAITIVDRRLPGRQRGAESQVAQQDAGRLPRRWCAW